MTEVMTSPLRYLSMCGKNARLRVHRRTPTTARPAARLSAGTPPLNDFTSPCCSILSEKENSPVKLLRLTRRMEIGLRLLHVAAVDHAREQGELARSASARRPPRRPTASPRLSPGGCWCDWNSYEQSQPCRPMP